MEREKLASMDNPAPSESTSLWTPESAVGWSMLFSPAFGAYLVMRNWQQLGEHRKAVQAGCWLWLAVAFLLTDLVLAGLGAVQHRRLGVPAWAYIVLFLSWYLGSARAQRNFLVARKLDKYREKSWCVPLLAAVGVAIAYVNLAGAIRRIG
jgi:hypothetical protein